MPRAVRASRRCVLPAVTVALRKMHSSPGLLCKNRKRKNMRQRTAVSRKPMLLSAAAIRRMKEYKFVHFLNPGAIRHTRSLGDACGLQTIGIHLVRLKQG